jgi:glycerol kinase
MDEQQRNSLYGGWKRAVEATMGFKPNKNREQ